MNRGRQSQHLHIRRIKCYNLCNIIRGLTHISADSFQQTLSHSLPSETLLAPAQIWLILIFPQCMSLLSWFLLWNKDSVNKAEELYYATYLMCTQEKSALHCGSAEESTLQRRRPTPLSVTYFILGKGFHQDFFPLTEAAILESTKFSKVPRTACVISC